MSLTRGGGPLAGEPAAAANYRIEGPANRIWFHDHPRRIRAVFGGEVVGDTERGRLLHETGILPVFYFPEEDLAAELLEPTTHQTHCPSKGDASYRSIRVGERVAENAVWAYSEPLDSFRALAGYAAIYFDRVDAWFEEDEEIDGHLRDPYHRVDVRESSRRVQVFARGELVADTTRPRMVFETGLPARPYVPIEDVRSDLVPSDKTTICPYKGTASYWRLKVGEEMLEDVVWGYPKPPPDHVRLAGLVAFDGDDIEVDVERRGLGERAGATG